MALLYGRYRLRSVRRRQIQAEPKASACIWRQLPISACIDQKAVPYAFYRTITHMFN